MTAQERSENACAVASIAVHGWSMMKQAAVLSSARPEDFGPPLLNERVLHLSVVCSCCAVHVLRMAERVTYVHT